MNDKQNIGYRDLFDGKFWWTFCLTMLISALAFLAIIFFVPRQFFEVISPSSDALAAIVGLPVGFAGALVAIILAKRSYYISYQQAQYEIISEAKAISLSAAELYWRLSESLRMYESAVNMSGKLLYSQKKRENIDDEISTKNKEIQRLIERSEVAFERQRDLLRRNVKDKITNLHGRIDEQIYYVESSIDKFVSDTITSSNERKLLSCIDLAIDVERLNRRMFAQNLLLIEEKESEVEALIQNAILEIAKCLVDMQMNPICRASFKLKFSDRAYKVLNELDSDYTPRFNKLTEQISVSSVMQLTERLRERAEGLTVQRATRNFAEFEFQKRIKSYRWDSNDGLWTKSVRSRARGELPDKKIELTSSQLISKIGSELNSVATRTESLSTIERLNVLGAHLGLSIAKCDYFDSRAGITALNTGAMHLMSIYGLFPKESDIRSIVELGIGEHKNINTKIVDIVVENLKDMGVDSCTSEWWCNCINESQKHANTLIWLLPK
ncbi:hypothetical protein [Vibrio alfacsensis]|uniref:hypothetical protein n=1 Tax=Vibrio alfacsensis TaxID=1074311 RepID=UPI004067C0DE